MPDRFALAWICFLPATLLGCGGSGDREPRDDRIAPPPAGRTVADLVGTAWSLEEIGGAPALERAEATLEFPEAGRAAGRGSCNQFSGPVEIGERSIRFGELVSTRMHCGDTVMIQETRYFAALATADRYEVNESTLRIESGDADDRMLFIRRRD